MTGALSPYKGEIWRIEQLDRETGKWEFHGHLRIWHYRIQEMIEEFNTISGHSRRLLAEYAQKHGINVADLKYYPVVFIKNGSHPEIPEWPFVLKGFPEKAKEFAEKKHKGQLDDLGKPYFEAHVLQVVRLLKIVSDDKELIAAAHLHDTLEDTNTTFQELAETFGYAIARLVYEVTHEGKKDEVGYYFPRLRSHKAFLIKFADRLSNLSRMSAWSQSRQEHYMKKSIFWKMTKEVKQC